MRMQLDRSAFGVVVAVLVLLSMSAAVQAFQPLALQHQPHTRTISSSSSTTTVPFSTRLYASTLDKSETASSSSSTTTSTKKTAGSPSSKTSKKDTTTTPLSLAERISNSGVASAAAMATAAVNAAVAMKELEAPTVDKSYIARGGTATEIDEDGLPLQYDKDLIQQYWNKERGALNRRWGDFVGKAVPFFTKMITLFIRDGKIVDDEIPALSRQARIDLQDLGPTFIKAGQMMSVRPDVLPQSTLDELQKLQDAVVPFSTEIAVQQIERELGGPLGQFFTSISQEPVAAASLAQVYLATLADGKNTRVAIKVQRPHVLSTVSKDLYVLRRAAEVVNGLVQRFAPQQRTDYVALLNEWAIGFYTELDFMNEAQNQETLRQMLLDKNITNVFVPKVYRDLCTRRILVSEWVDGVKLSTCSPEQIAQVTPYAQEAFLTQLFEFGFFHADPHPGNLLYVQADNDGISKTKPKLALIDCGLMAQINEKDRDNMISAVIHLANKDYASLVDDFIKLQILPPDSNRAAIIPLMDKALSPYVKGGGAKKYEEELKKLYGMQDGSVQSQVGGFQAMTQDALTVLNDIPFSIPPYFAILGRAIVTLEGVALTGNPDYGIIMESYPFIARKLLREERPEIQKALSEVLYSGDGDASSSGLKLTRLLALLNNAAGAVATKEGAAFVDLDAVPEDGITLKQGLQFLLSDNAESIRNLLENEVDNIVDILGRQIFRRAFSEAMVMLTPPRPPAIPFVGDVFPKTPALEDIPLPLLLPGLDDASSTTSRPTVAVMNLRDFTEAVAPKLSQEEEIYAIGLADGAKQFLGDEVGALIKGERVLSLNSVEVFLNALRSGAFGRSDLFNPETARPVIDFVLNTVHRLQRSSSKETQWQAELEETLGSLTPSERERLDTIVNELTLRAIRRAVQRLSSVQRLL